MLLLLVIFIALKYILQNLHKLFKSIWSSAIKYIHTFLKFYIYLRVCACNASIFLCVQCLWRPEEGARSLWDEVTGTPPPSLSTWVLGPELWSLQEQYVFLSAEPSLYLSFTFFLPQNHYHLLSRSLSNQAPCSYKTLPIFILPKPGSHQHIQDSRILNILDSSLTWNHSALFSFCV